MPEGHTLHRLAAQHDALFAGHPVRADSPQGRFAAGAARIRRVESVEAYGKHLLYDLGPEGYLHVHLGLYGSFRDGAGPPPEPRGAVRLRLVGNGHWVELRGAAACELYDEDQRRRLLARLGPDPLRPDGDAAAFVRRVASSRAPIAGLLMDQSVVAGVGNVFRAEVLFRAGLDPYRPGSAVGEETLRALWSDLRRLLRAGVRAGRIVTTRRADRDHRGPITRDQSFYVYHRAGLPCRVCGTEVRTAVLAGRNLFWCPTCQPSG
ncbi:MAG TPA: zinc finger domain-containing protein [Mycobacteriales bacterium]